MTYDSTAGKVVATVAVVLSAMIVCVLLAGAFFWATSPWWAIALTVSACFFWAVVKTVGRR